jgi:CheY-like chemotaxis protein
MRMQQVIRTGYRPELALPDLNLPGMDGYQMLEVLKADARLRRRSDKTADHQHLPESRPRSIGTTG